MLKQIFVFESRNFFSNRNIIIFFIFFILLSAFSCDGIRDYKTIMEGKTPFQETEIEKVSLFIQYTFYGIRGVRLLFLPSPLSVLFNNLAVYSGLIANVDTAEGLYIYNNSFKGKALFSESGGFMDFSGILLLIGCFIALIYGYNITKKKEYLKLVAGISGNKKVSIFILLSRIILLSLAFVLFSGLSLLWLLINGINVVNVFFGWFVIGLILVTTFFIITGALIGSLKNEMLKLIVLVCVYFSFLFLIPWVIEKAVYIDAVKNINSNYEFEYKKLKVMMDFERRSYEQIGTWKSGDVAPDEVKALVQSGQEIEYKKLQEYEKKRLDEIFRRVKVYRIISAIFPTTFYLSVNKELSSKGYHNFIIFYRRAHQMKYDFITFYIEKKFYNKLPETGVEPFIKGDENLFYAKSRLPDNFVLGLFLNVFYIFLLFLLNYKIHCKRFRTGEYKKPEIEFPGDQNSVFVLCKDRKLKDEIFRYYEQQNAICIDKINTKDFRFDGINPEYMFNYFCRISGVDKQEAVKNLALLGITDLKGESHEHETILKIYAAVKTAAESEFIVLNDFLKRESKKLEEDVFELITAFEKRGKKIIYLSTEMYYTKVSLDKKIKVENIITFPLFMDKITVR